MGLNRIFLTQYVYGERLGMIDGSLDNRFEGLRDEGAYAYLRRVPQLADVELAGEVQIITYRDRDITSLKSFIPQFDDIDVYLITPQNIPEGSRVSAWIQGVDLRAEVVDADRLSIGELSEQGCLLVPSDWSAWLEETGYAEMILFESSATDILTVRSTVQRVKALLRLDKLRDVRMSSGLAIMERLETLRAQQSVWSIVIRVVVSFLIVLIFASTSFLEYRQNIYLSALLQSLGVSRVYIFIRYLVEQVILLFFGLTLSICALWLVLNQMSIPSEFESYIQLSSVDPPSIYREWFFELSATALISLLPILFGLRKEVGRILQ